MSRPSSSATTSDSPEPAVPQTLFKAGQNGRLVAGFDKDDAAG